MLIEKIRAHSGSWWFRAFLGILAITFGFLWYGNDLILGSRGGGATIASVGGTKITLQQFSRVLNMEINRIETNIKQKLSLDQQKQIYPYILERLINDTLLTKEAQRLGLTVTDNFLRRIVTEDKNFQNEKKIFDKQKFDFFLAQAGLTEANFFHEIRQEILRNELMEALFGGSTVPNVIAQRVYTFMSQKRVLSLATIESSKLKLDKVPTSAEINGFYDKNKALFTAPEFRDISALILDDSSVVSLIQVDENQIKKTYESHQEEFKGLSFDKVKEKISHDLRKKMSAEKLYELTNKIDDDIGGGATLEEIAKKYKLSLVNFSRVTNTGNIDSYTQGSGGQFKDKALALKIIKDAFLQTVNTIGNVNEAGDGRYYITRVDKIHLPQLRSFDQVKKDVYEALVNHLQTEKAANLGMQWVEKVNQGGNLEALAGLQGMKVSQIKISRQGPVASSTIHFSDEFLAKLYLLPKKFAAATSFLNDKGKKDIIVACVKDIEAVSIEAAKNEKDKFKIRMRQELINDLLNQYLESIRQRYSVDYNKKLFAQLMNAKS